MNEFINKIIQGDCLEVLKTLPSESVDLIITSPPYYGLRKYGDYEQQIGLEETFDEFLKKILEITAELKRVLKPSGQFWLNFGDCYASAPAGNKSISEANVGTDGLYVRKAIMGEGAQSNITNRFDKDKYGGKNGIHCGRNRSNFVQDKCMMMMPERIALKMIDEQGWILRNKIKWAKQVYLKKDGITKGSVMPTSVKDRFNESGEELYFFVKNKKYYSDLDAVRLPNQVLGITDLRTQEELNKYPEAYQKGYRFNYRVRDAVRKSGQPQFKASEEEIRNYKSLEARLDDTKNKDTKSSRTANIKKLLSEVRLGIKPNTGMTPLRNTPEKLKSMGVPATYIGATGQDHNLLNNPMGKNLPTVWLIGSEPHNFQKELDVECDHFAIFPQALVEIPIKFGCPEGGIVLDPFMGSGTVAVMAKKLGRNFIGIELNQEYIIIANKRLSQSSLFMPDIVSSTD